MLLERIPMADVLTAARQSQQHQHSRKGGGGSSPPHEKCSVGERLYYQGHLCNHRNCAANSPDYNVKAALPPKKFLVAKKHAYGGLEEKGGEKTRTKSSNSTTTTSSDYRCDRNHALQSLTNSVLSTETGKARSNRTNAVLPTIHGKAKSNGMQHSRLTRDTSSSDRKKVVAERTGRPTGRSSNSVHSHSSTGRSSVTTESHQSEAQTLRLSNATSPLPSQATEQSSKRCEDSASPESSVTSIRITQKSISTRIGDEKKEAHDVAAGPTTASSPTVSVGSNHDTDISSLKETTVTVLEQGEIVEQSTANVGDVLCPPGVSESSPSNNDLHTETTYESSAPFDSGPTTVSESLSPSTQSTSFAPRTPERSSLTTQPVSEISSSTLRKSAEGEEEVNYDSSSPSVTSSRPAISEPLTSSVTSVKSRPRRSPTSHGRSSLTTPPPSSATKLARKFINNLKESSGVGSPTPTSSSSYPGSLANRPSRVSRNSVSPTQADSSPAPTNASRLAKKFISDLQERTVARKASTKGVRSIELRGGKAKSYSKTTVTSWNLTTTTVETTVSVSGGTPENNVDSGLSASGPGKEVSIKTPEQSGMKDSQAAAASSNDSTVDSKPPNEAPAMVKCVKNVKTLEEVHSESETVSLKFVKNAKSLEELHSERETVHLKHGEVAERRLSEEYLTNHALEKKISDKDHRVKVLVHAFETLATLSDAEVPGSEDETLNPRMVHESSSAITVAV